MFTRITFVKVAALTLNGGSSPRTKKTIVPRAKSVVRTVSLKWCTDNFGSMKEDVGPWLNLVASVIPEFRDQVTNKPTNRANQSTNQQSTNLQQTYNPANQQSNKLREPTTNQQTSETAIQQSNKPTNPTNEPQDKPKPKPNKQNFWLLLTVANSLLGLAAHQATCNGSDTYVRSSSYSSGRRSEMLLCEKCQQPFPSFDELQVHFITEHHEETLLS